MIPAELRELMAPQERFERIRRRAVRLGPRLADLSYPNPRDTVDPQVHRILRQALDTDRALDFQYTPYGGHTLVRRAVADALSDSHGLAFTPMDVALTPGAMAALQIAMRTSGSPGDEIVVPTPCWLDYPLYVRAVGMVPRLVPLPEPAFELEVERIAAACGPRTCAVLLCQPSNPSGRVHRREDLERLAEALAGVEREHGRPITVIADETHRDFAPGFVSPAAVLQRTLLVYSFGKYHLLQGQRAGYVAASPTHPDGEAARAELVHWLRATAAYAPTALMQRAIPQLLALHHDHGAIERRRERARRALEGAGMQVAPNDATFFAWARLPAGEEDYDFARRAARDGVLVVPGPVFHHPGWFRISLTGPDATLDQGLERLCSTARPTGNGTSKSA